MEDIRIDCNWAIVDVEVSLSDHKIHDIGALRYDGAVYHGCFKGDLTDFLQNVVYICGHNIIHHDAKYLFGDEACKWILVDTLYMSPLLFPERPYHKLVKDDKLIRQGGRRQVYVPEHHPAGGLQLRQHHPHRARPLGADTLREGGQEKGRHGGPLLRQ